MSLILSIETTTKNCSVALFKKGKLIALKEQCSDNYSHAEQLTLFITEIIEETQCNLTNINAVALSKGPGSYTGLRIGTSVAKGLCYSLGIPLISVSTLKAMANDMALIENFELFCPMIDARRMEVFSAVYDKDNKEIRAVQADIVDDQTYKTYLKREMLFFGDGALKCKEIIDNKNAHFLKDIYPSAKNLGKLANTKFIKKDFEDIAYFEPYYLKDFVVGKKS